MWLLEKKLKQKKVNNSKKQKKHPKLNNLIQLNLIGLYKKIYKKICYKYFRN